MRAVLLAAILIIAAGCERTGRAYVDVPLHGAGIEPLGPFEAQGWTVQLDVAEVALGPLFFCATEAADPEFCDASVLELLEPVTIDARDAAPEMLATMRGITGTARSVMFDYGVSWLPTETRPRGERSARFSGRASREGETFAFSAEVAIAPPMQGSFAVRGQRISAHEIGAGDTLVVRVDPRAWWSRVDFDRLAARRAGPDEPVVLRPGDPDYEALVVAMTAGVLPTFEWGTR